MSIWQKINDYDSDKAAPSTWMSRIAHNRAIDYLRRHKNTIDIDNIAEPADKGASNIDDLAQSQIDNQLHHCLKQLDEKVFYVVLNVYFYHLSYQAVAEQINQPVNTIKSWVRRSFPVVKKCLEMH